MAEESLRALIHSGRVPIGDLCAVDVLDIPIVPTDSLQVTIGILRPQSGLRMTRGWSEFLESAAVSKGHSPPKTMVVLTRPVICVKVFYLE